MTQIDNKGIIGPTQEDIEASRSGKKWLGGIIEKVTKSRAAKAGLFGLGGTVILGGGYLAYENIPAFHQKNVAPFDIDKLDSKHQAIVFGKNTQEPTSEDMEDFLNSVVPDPGPENRRVTRSIVPRMGTDAGEIEAWRTRGPYGDVPADLHLKIKNPNTSFGFDTEGVNVEKGKLFRIRYGYLAIYNLGVDRDLFVYIESNDLAPTIETPWLLNGRDNYTMEQALAEEGKEFDAVGSFIFTTKNANSEIMLSAILMKDSEDAAFRQPLDLDVKNGKVLISTSLSAP